MNTRTYIIDYLRLIGFRVTLVFPTKRFTLESRTSFALWLRLDAKSFLFSSVIPHRDIVCALLLLSGLLTDQVVLAFLPGGTRILSEFIDINYELLTILSCSLPCHAPYV